jgi:hypothetical protein
MTPGFAFPVRTCAGLLIPLFCAVVATVPEGMAQQRLQVSGFVGTTLFVQDRLFDPGNGQNAQYLAFDQDDADWWHGGDVRNTRLAATMGAARLPNRWRASGLIEADFFGDFSPGAFGREQPMPRIRLAYAQLERGGTRLRFGQDWSPIYGFVPESVTHIAFPLGWGSAGLIGWRFPGIFLRHRLSGTDRRGGAHLHVAVMRGGWGDEDDPELPTAGQRALVPQVQARLDLKGHRQAEIPWEMYLAGHFDRKEIDAPGEMVDGLAVTGGLRLTPGPLAFMVNVYTGRALGHHSAHISQFGDYTSTGVQGQLGLHLDRSWSLWAFGGIDTVAEDDLFPGDRSRNVMFDFALRYATGPLEVGANWMNVRTRWHAPPGMGADVEMTGNQIALSSVLSF